MSTHDAIYANARAILDDDLDSFFANPTGTVAASSSSSSSSSAKKQQDDSDDDDDEDEDEDEEDDADSSMEVDDDDNSADAPILVDLNDSSLLQAPRFLDLATHLRKVKDLAVRFDAEKLVSLGCPHVLANVFARRNDLTLALQHDLISAWAVKTGQPIPDCVMAQLLILTFMAPDSVLAAEACRSAVQMYERQQSSFQPTHEAVAKALDYFGGGAREAFLFDPTSIAQSPVTAASTSPAALSPIVSKWSMLSGWLTAIAAGFNSAKTTTMTSAAALAVDDNVGKIKILKSLLLLSADAEIQTHCQNECFLAVNAALRLCIDISEQDEASRTALDEVIISIMETDADLLSTVSISHIASFLSPAGKLGHFTTKFASFCLTTRFPAGCLPWVEGTMKGDVGGQVSTAELGRVIDAIANGGDSSSRSSRSKFNSMLLDKTKFVNFCCFVSLLHTLSAAASTWDKKQRRILRDKCEELRMMIEETLDSRRDGKFLVVEVLDRLQLAHDILEYHEEQARGSHHLF